MNSFVIAKVLVVNDKGEILALRRSQTDERRPGEWDFPGGWVDAGEDVRAAVIREAHEEAGLQLADPKLVFGLSEMTPKHGSGTWLLYIDHIVGSPNVTLSFEHDDFAWRRPEDLLKEISYDRHQKMLNYVLAHKLLRS